MPQKPGSHRSYVRDHDVVVEWYDFGKGAIYEFAKLLIFDPAAQADLVRELALPPRASPNRIASAIAKKFRSFWDVEDFATDRGIGTRIERDFNP